MTSVGTTTSASDAFRSECDFGLTHYGESDLHGDGLGQDGDEVMFLGLLMDTKCQRKHASMSLVVICYNTTKLVTIKYTAIH